MGYRQTVSQASTYGMMAALYFVIAATSLNAQRLRDRVVWARERYTMTFDRPERYSTFLPEVKEWNIHDTLGIADRGRRITGSPNYDVNFENVIHLGAGVFTRHADTTFNGAERLVTPIRCAVLVQNGRDGHTAEFSPNKRVLQVFTVESRPYTVTDPTDPTVRDSWAYRASNREGLGLGYGNRPMLMGLTLARTPDPAKINIMVGGAAVVHPYILRFNDPTIDATKVRATVIADVSGDSRDEVVLFVESGAGTDIIVLQTPPQPNAGQPLNYQFTRINATTIPAATLQPSLLTSVVAADLNGDGNVELVLAVKGSQAQPQGFLAITPRTSWTSTTRYEVPLADVNIASTVGIVAADLIRNSVRKHSLLAIQPNGPGHDVLSLSLQNGRLVKGPATLALDAFDAAPGTIACVAAGDLDGNGDDELVLAHTRRHNGVVSSVLTMIDSGNGAWRTERLARFMPEDLDASMMRRMVVSNLDVDVRERADVGILYHGAPSATPRDDLFLLWSALPAHAVNDYAVSVPSSSGRNAPFLPHGWWNIRLVTGLSDQEPGRRIHVTDYWAKTDYRLGWSTSTKGIVFTPDSGRISMAELGRYSSIYNCIVPERQHYTDLFLFGRASRPADDQKSVFYYHNAEEVRQALTAFITQASTKNLYVLPYLGMHDPNSYKPSPSNTAQVEWFDWSDAADGPAQRPLPPYYASMLTSSIHTLRPFLGWLTADEPSGLIPPNGLNFRPRFTDTAVVNAAVRPPQMARTMQDHYRVIRSYTPSKPIYQVYHYIDDFEFYRNAHDVALMDFYPYVQRYQTQTLRDAGGNSVSANDGRQVQQRGNPLPDSSAVSVQYSWVPLLRRQMDHVIRCDKEAAMNIAQGIGDNSVSGDFDPRRDTLLRALPGFRNLTIDEARLQVLAPAVIGHRGAFWWDGYTWMGGAPASDITVVDPAFERHDPEVSPGVPKRNVFGSLMHHAPNNMASARTLRATIDTASAEFNAFIPTFLSESIRGKVSIASIMPGEGVYDHDVVSALHTDPATQQRWLFIANLSNRRIGNTRVQVDGIDADAVVHRIAGPRFRADALAEVRSNAADGAVQFNAELPPLSVVGYTFIPTKTETGKCWFWPF